MSGGRHLPVGKNEAMRVKKVKGGKLSFASFCVIIVRGYYYIMQAIRWPPRR